MKEKHSLLNKIKSNFILKDIMILAFSNIKSVLKVVAYDKILLNKLDINIKDYYDYKTKILVEKEGSKRYIFFKLIFNIFLNFIPLLIYNIIISAKGKFNDKILIEGYNKKKKNYVDIMDNYITNIYLGYLAIFYFLIIIYYKSNKIALKGKIKFLMETIDFFITLSYIIMHIVKYSFTKQIIKKEFIEEKDKFSWFYGLDLAFIFLISFPLILNCSFTITYICEYCSNVIGDINDINEIDDKKSIILSQINGFDISNFELPLEFENLNKISKIEMIFKKENMKKYMCKLDDTQIKLIIKINQLRIQNNIPQLKYDEEQQLPDYIINKKTELVFYEEKNIYKLSINYYLIKYLISECQKDINDKKVINILTNDFLDRINIIRKDSYEYIALFNSKYKENVNYDIIRENNKNNNINIYTNLKDRFDLPSNNISNTEDRFNESEQSKNLSMTEVKEND